MTRRVKAIATGVIVIVICLLWFGSSSGSDVVATSHEEDMLESQREELNQWKSDPNDPTTLDKQPIEVEPITVAVDKLMESAGMVVFSKSYCPYSKAAKQLLFEQYKITPEPKVIELDIHARGSEVQKELKARTGRSTVPNIIVSGTSIGGADELGELAESGRLEQRIKSLNSKLRIEKMKEPS